MFCEENEVAYTRYADDLSFSADTSLRLAAIEQYVIDLCRRMDSPRLTINPDKIVRVSKKKARRVTGLILTNEAKLSIGRDQKRRIRATVHHFATGRLNDAEVRELRGMLAYIRSVEPSFIQRLRQHYGASVIRRIQAGS